MNADESHQPLRSEEPPRKIPLSICAMIVGGFLAATAPVLGVLGTMAGMVRAMDAVTDPGRIIDSFSIARLSSVAGVVLGAIGCLVFFVGFVAWLSKR